MQVKTWYRSLSPLKQIGICFLIFWAGWIANNLTVEKFFSDEKHSLLYNILSAALMALFMTAMFNWGKIKLLLKKQ